MQPATWTTLLLTVALLTGLTIACGEEDANDQHIGAICASLEDCDDNNGDTPELTCVTDFKGGYCGRKGCTTSEQCPKGSLCVDHEDATYCFLVCQDKVECNQHRPLESESNCSSSVDPVEGGDEKVCVPPTGS